MKYELSMMSPEKELMKFNCPTLKEAQELRFFNVLQTQKDGTILRKFEKLNTYEAESVFFKIANSYPVRYGAQNVKMIEINPQHNKNPKQ